MTMGLQAGIADPALVKTSPQARAVRFVFEAGRSRASHHHRHRASYGQQRVHRSRRPWGTRDARPVTELCERLPTDTVPPDPDNSRPARSRHRLVGTQRLPVLLGQLFPDRRRRLAPVTRPPRRAARPGPTSGDQSTDYPARRRRWSRTRSPIRSPLPCWRCRARGAARGFDVRRVLRVCDLEDGNRHLLKGSRVLENSTPLPAACRQAWRRRSGRTATGVGSYQRGARQDMSLADTCSLGLVRALPAHQGAGRVGGRQHRRLRARVPDHGRSAAPGQLRQSRSGFRSHRRSAPPTATSAVAWVELAERMHGARARLPAQRGRHRRHRAQAERGTPVRVGDVARVELVPADGAASPS